MICGVPETTGTDLNFKDAPVQSSLSGECYTVHIDTACTRLFKFTSIFVYLHTYIHLTLITYSYQYTVWTVYTVWKLAHFFCI